MQRLSRALLARLLLVAGLLLTSCGGEADKPLAPFQGEGFTVLMPGKPERSEQSAPSASGELKVVAYTSESRDKAYLVGYTDLPGGVEIDLPGAIRGAAGGVKGTVTDEVAATHQGFPARDARITGADDGKGNKGTAFLRVINANNRLYQLQYIEAGGDVRSPSTKYPEFLASLKIA